MSKSIKLGTTMLVAGTCIGSGMVALPMTLSKLGILFSSILILAIWCLTYYTALISVELNLRAGKGMPLVELAGFFSGKIAKIISATNLKIMSYLLLAAFIYGSSSILQKLLLNTNDGWDFDILAISGAYSLVSIMLLLLPVRYVDYVNRILFFCLMGIVFTLVFSMVSAIEWSNLPLLPEKMPEIKSLSSIVPIVFTCFGFQVIFHTMMDYTHKDQVIMKKALFWGSLIPAMVYILWNTSIISIIYTNNYNFYTEMVTGSASVGSLVHELSKISNSPYIQVAVWSILLLAIITSVVGVGIGLRDSLGVTLRNVIDTKWICSILSVLIAIIPSYLMIFLVSDAFMKMLGLAGMMLVFIAIVIPIYLFYKSSNMKLFYPELKRNWLTISALIAGITIVICQLSGSF